MIVLLKNLIRIDTGMAVAAAACQPGKGRNTPVRCSNVTAQPQVLWAGHLIGIFVPQKEDQIHEGDNVGYYAGVQDGPDVDDGPPHTVTLLVQVFKICAIPDQERHVQQLYVGVFSSGKTDAGRADLVEHSTAFQSIQVLCPCGGHPKELVLRRPGRWRTRSGTWFDKGSLIRSDTWSSLVILV